MAAMAVEAVSLTDHWVDEAGIRPVNRVATRLAHDYDVHVDLRGAMVLPRLLEPAMGVAALGFGGLGGSREGAWE
ncbi:hypothetical protein [Kribbella sp. VKM Ac-2568]|uniref:hypothetical protein n=1 Tax=Kribbella sp. VKM Ac-2568 TaxID=2512219 RepID=UPI0010492DC9|nr:hypothetical protein [Kribbella sp. VKM Ac-2568]TCM45083.1 hypothetical protein EV648_107235 [Kribbella sp. VKM Ac-2568]